jgi:cell division protein FtsL
MAEQPSRRTRAASQRSKRSRAKREARVKRLRIQRPWMRLALILVVLVGLLFAFVYPTRTFLDQRDESNKARAQLEVLQTENARLVRESKRLSTDAEIERLARQKYGLVRPGERPFVILPAPSSTVPPPTSTAPVAP